MSGTHLRMNGRQPQRTHAQMDGQRENTSSIGSIDSPLTDCNFTVRMLYRNM